MLRALYFTPKQLAAFNHTGIDSSQPALIVTAADDAGHELGITFVPSGHQVTIAGVRLRVTLGTYPALAIAAAPPAWALILGIVLFVFGVVWAALARRPAAPLFNEPAASAS
ncbi:MAG TPA: hypothetical protein VE591_09530, partial [Candidatus Acidoferrum sp.]|nr:hypothetical protein [Candidatus Acidoferrum sp.]